MDVSQITDFLLVSAEPRAEDVKEIVGHKVELVISMLQHRPSKALGQQPLRSLWFRTYDTFFTPISIDQLTNGVHAAQEIIEKGGRVLVHCQRGRHRSIIMAAAILIAGGLSADEAISLLKERRPISDPHAWYVRRQIHRFEKHWKETVCANGKRPL